LLFPHSQLVDLDRPALTGEVQKWKGRRAGAPQTPAELGNSVIATRFFHACLECASPV
jgi:hypothetical protein